MTNESKVYFALRPPSPCLRLGSAEEAATVSRGWSATVSRMRRSCPVASRAAAPISPRKWPSIHSRVKSFGTEMTRLSSVSSTPSASANHVRYVVSLSAPLSRPATSDHRLCAVSSTWRLTRRVPLLHSPRGGRAYQCAPGQDNEVTQRKSPLFAGFSPNPQPDPQLWRNRCSIGTTCAATTGVSRRAVWTTVRGRASSILAASAWPPTDLARSLTREADLSAERTPPEAPARLPCTHGDSRGARDPQAAPCEGAQAPLRLTRGSCGPRVDVQRRHRLSRSRDFDAVYRQGRSVSTRFLVLYSFPRGDDGPPRVGFAVPRGTGSAVVRNRLKR